jgi:hypothetical protein
MPAVPAALKRVNKNAQSSSERGRKGLLPGNNQYDAKQFKNPAMAFTS